MLRLSLLLPPRKTKSPTVEAGALMVDLPSLTLSCCLLHLCYRCPVSQIRLSAPQKRPSPREQRRCILCRLFGWFTVTLLCGGPICDASSPRRCPLSASACSCRAAA